MPITDAEARLLTIDFCRAYPGARQVGYRFRQDIASFNYRSPAEEFKGGLVPGTRDRPGEVHIPLSNIDNAHDFTVTLRHEVLGHYGISTFQPDEKRALLDGLITAQDQPGIKALWENVNHRYAGEPLLIRAEEVFTLHAEGIEPDQHVGKTQVNDRGQQSLAETCINRSRPMQIDDLNNIALMIAQGLHDNSRTQQNFQSPRTALRKDEIMENKPVTPNQADFDRLAAKRAREFAQTHETLGLNTVEPNIEKKRQSLPQDQDAQRTAWLKKAEENAPKQQSDKALGGNHVESEEIFTATKIDIKLAVPPDVEKRYIHVGNKFYHSKNTDLVAFEDKGNKLETKSNSEMIAGSMVRIAEARGWDELKVTGSEAFRREVWLAAAARGMQVKGYTPTDKDKAALAKLMKKMQTNKVEINEKNHENANSAPEKRGFFAPKAGPEKWHDPNVVLTAHGAAKYMHDPKNTDSYYVTTRDSQDQEKTTWGVDLERAMNESGAKVGDRIVLANEGKKYVTVRSPVYDKDGNVTRYEEKDTHRNAWNIQRAEAFRDSPEEAVKKHPELAGAAAAVAAIEKKVQADGLSAEQRAVVMARVHENVVNSIERGHIPEVLMRETVETKREAREEKELSR